MFITEHGYVKIHVGLGHPHSDNYGYCYEHRIVMEKLLGRWPERHELVHHINGDKTDNRPANLQLVFGIAYHRFLHRKRKDRRLPWEGNPNIICGCGCGTVFKKYDRWRRPRVYLNGHRAYLKD